MSAATRVALAILRRRYANTLEVDLQLVLSEDWADEGEGRVWCPTRPDLPTWTLGQSEVDQLRSMS